MRIRHSRSQGIWRYIAQSDHYWLQRSAAPWPDGRHVLPDSRFDRQPGRTPRRVAVEAWTPVEFPRRGGIWNCWHDFLSENNPASATIGPGESKRRNLSRALTMILLRVAATLCFLAVALGRFLLLDSPGPIVADA